MWACTKWCVGLFHRWNNKFKLQSNNEIFRKRINHELMFMSNWQNSCSNLRVPILIRARFWKNLAKRLIIASGSNLLKVFELGRREAAVESTVVTVETVLYFWEYRNTRTMQNCVEKCWIGTSLVTISEYTFNGCTNLKLPSRQEKH